MHVSCNKGSNALMLCLIVGVTGAVLCTALLLSSKQYQSSKLKEKGAGQALSAAQFDLTLASERFRISGNYLPAWYPEPYPNQYQLKNNEKPLIQVLSPKVDVSQANVPLTENAVRNQGGVVLHYDLDRSNMASILKASDVSKLTMKNGKRIEAQPANIAAGALKLLNTDTLKNFFSFPSSGWPKSGQTLMGIEQAKLYFDSYITTTLPDSSVKIQQISVIVERSDSKGGVTRNLASLSIDAPPDPRCQLSIAPTVEPVEEGQSIDVTLSSDSITQSASVQASGKNIPVSVKAQSIRNLKKYVSVSTSPVSLLVPNPETLPANADGTKRWQISGLVTGVDSTHSAGVCSLDVKVKVKAPPALPLPIADLKANGLDGVSGIVKVPFYSTVKLTWSSANANSCTMSGINGLSGESMQYTLTTENTYTLTCSGPGGTSTDSIQIKFSSRWYQVDGEYCVDFCANKGQVNTASPEAGYKATKCTSGEMRSAAAMAAGIQFTHGTKLDLPYPRTWDYPESRPIVLFKSGKIRYVSECYPTTTTLGKIVADHDDTDITVGCHCADKE